MSDTGMFRITICHLSKFLRRQIRCIEKMTVLASHTVIRDYEASHYLDVVLTDFAYVVMFDNVSSAVACRSSHRYLPLHTILLHPSTEASHFEVLNM